METVVIALGGNALLDPSSKQSISSENINIHRVCRDIARLYNTGKYRIVITHGNGTQFGDELIRNEHSKAFVPKLPLYMLNAETQASIGTLIELSMRNSINRAGRGRVSTILAHVLVDRDDSGFKRPSKPIGPFYTKAQIDRERGLHKFDYVRQDKGYRMVIASPKPVEIMERDAICSESKRGIVITCGGGGIPVVKRGKTISCVDAVIDKDRTSALLASSIGARLLVILTNADSVYVSHRGKKNKIRSVKARELEHRLDSFEEGTIRPKLEACVDFVKKGGKEAFIGNIFQLGQILKGEKGTKIY